MSVTSAVTVGPTYEGPPERRSSWPWILAVAVVAQPLLLAVNATFHPEVELNGPSLLAGAAESPVTWYAVHLIAALGAMLGVPAALGIRRLVAGRDRRLADAAVGAAVVAAVVLSMTFAMEASVLRLVAGAGVGTTEAVALADAFTETPEFFAVLVGAAAATLAGVLFAIALLRARSVPRWLPFTMLVGSLGTVAATPGSLVGPLAFVLLTVAGAALAPRVGRASSG